MPLLARGMERNRLIGLGEAGLTLGEGVAPVAGYDRLPGCEPTRAPLMNRTITAAIVTTRANTADRAVAGRYVDAAAMVPVQSLLPVPTRPALEGAA